MTTAGASAKPSAGPSAPTTQENANPVISTPGKASSAILTNRRMKSPERHFQPAAEQDDRGARRHQRREHRGGCATIGANSVWPAMPSAMATTKDGNGVSTRGIEAGEAAQREQAERRQHRRGGRVAPLPRGVEEFDRPQCSKCRPAPRPPARARDRAGAAMPAWRWYPSWRFRIWRESCGA